MILLSEEIMIYYINKTKEFDKQLKKFDKVTQDRILAKLDDLVESPDQRGKVVGVTKSRLRLYELRFGISGGISIRIYYTIEHKVIVIEKIMFDGTVSIIKANRKKSKHEQQKTIDRLKKEH